MTPLQKLIRAPLTIGESVVGALKNEDGTAKPIHVENIVVLPAKCIAGAATGAYNDIDHHIVQPIDHHLVQPMEEGKALAPTIRDWVKGEN